MKFVWSSGRQEKSQYQMVTQLTSLSRLSFVLRVWTTIRSRKRRMCTMHRVTAGVCSITEWNLTCTCQLTSQGSSCRSMIRISWVEIFVSVSASWTYGIQWCCFRRAVKSIWRKCGQVLLIHRTRMKRRDLLWFRYSYWRKQMLIKIQWVMRRRSQIRTRSW